MDTDLQHMCYILLTEDFFKGVNFKSVLTDTYLKMSNFTVRALHQ